MVWGILAVVGGSIALAIMLCVIARTPEQPRRPLIFAHGQHHAPRSFRVTADIVEQSLPRVWTGGRPPWETQPIPALPAPDRLDGMVRAFVPPAIERPRAEIAAVLPAYVIEALGGHDSVDACVDSICVRAARAVAV